MWMWAFTLASGAVLVSLFDDPWVWWSLGSMLALTIAMTFVLPKVHRPRKTGLGNTGLPENAADRGACRGAAGDRPGGLIVRPSGDFVIVFTSTATTSRETGRRHDDRAARAGPRTASCRVSARRSRPGLRRLSRGVSWWLVAPWCTGDRRPCRPPSAPAWGVLTLVVFAFGIVVPGRRGAPVQLRRSWWRS